MADVVPTQMVRFPCPRGLNIPDLQLPASSGAASREGSSQLSRPPMHFASALGQQQITPLTDRRLRCFGKPLQQPWQGHCKPDMIIPDLKVTGRRLTHGADPKHHAVLVPFLLVDLQNRDARRRPRQPTPEASGRLLTPKLMRDRHDERCGHVLLPISITSCNREFYPVKRFACTRLPPMELSGFPK